MSHKTGSKAEIKVNGHVIGSFSSKVEGAWQSEPQVMVIPRPVTDEVIVRIQKTMEQRGPNGKRLKKYCPCQRCCDWRKQRMFRKQQLMMVETMRASFNKSVGESPQVWRTPIIGNDNQMPVSIGRAPSPAPAAQPSNDRPVSIYVRMIGGGGGGSK